MNIIIKNQTVYQKLKVFAPQADVMPSVVFIHQLVPYKIIYMNSWGLNEFRTTLEELQELNTVYGEKFFNLEDSEDYFHKLKFLLSENNLDETFTFFQQIKFKENDDWAWLIGSTRIFFKDSINNPSHIITVGLSMDRIKHNSKKTERFLAEKIFFTNNLNKFLTLGKREKEVLKLVALGKNSPEIAKELFISVQTVNSHRKSIKKKLGIKSGYDFTLYAHAYELI